MNDDIIKSKFKQFMNRPVPNDVIRFAKEYQNDFPSDLSEVAFSQGLGFICGFRAGYAIAEMNAKTEKSQSEAVK